MTSLSEIGGLYQSTSANLKDAQTKAFMYACDRQIQKLLECAEKTKVWCALDAVDEKYLDYIAAECGVMFYESSMSVEVKRKLIDNALYWHIKAGTTAVVKEMIATIFGEGTIEEWYEYGGAPYCFRIKTDTVITYDIMDQFNKIIKRVKNVRSRMDAIRIERKSEDVAYVAGCLKMRKRAAAIREGDI